MWRNATFGLKKGINKSQFAELGLPSIHLNTGVNEKHKCADVYICLCLTVGVEMRLGKGFIKQNHAYSFLVMNLHKALYIWLLCPTRLLYTETAIYNDRW